MNDSPQPAFPDVASGDRLESWKEIAAYLRRDVKTVQRWEKREAMPVHRHVHDKLGSVYAFRKELDVWTRNRRVPPSQDGPSADGPELVILHDAPPSPAAPPSRSSGATWTWVIAAFALLVVLTLGALWRRDVRRDESNPLSSARFVQLTDFNGLEQSAAISRDGKFVAFLSDRDGQMNVWLTQVGSGDFHNLTQGTAPVLVNPAVRTLDFSPDGTLVTYWTNRPGASGQSEIAIRAIPVLGGSTRVYLDGAAEYRWSDDGKRMVYHTAGPGDPMFVRDGGEQATPRQIFVAPEGLHAHFPLWSPDGAFIYFVQGNVPDRMDVWRLRTAGGGPERMTQHDSAVSYPVFLDPRHLLYLATDPEGSGPWIYSLDLDTRVSRRASFGIERFTSLSASSDGRRVAATVATPKTTLWQMSLDSAPVTNGDAREITLTTGNGSSPRFGNGFLLYICSTGVSDTIWRLQGGKASQVWTSPERRVIGGPALSHDGRRVAFSTRGSDGKTELWIADTDGAHVRRLATSLDVEGSPAWAPDGHSVAVGAVVNGLPRLFSVSTDDGRFSQIVNESAMDPAWAPDGAFVVFSGSDVGTIFRMKAVDGTGQAHPIPPLTLTRGGRHVVFIDGKRSLVLLRGDMRHKNLWAVDLETGAERQLTNFGPAFDIRDFDVTPDGRQLVVEQVQEHSNIVLLDLGR